MFVMRSLQVDRSDMRDSCGREIERAHAHPSGGQQRFLCPLSRMGSFDLSSRAGRNRFDTMRIVAIIAASLVGLSTAGAFASGVYRRHSVATAAVRAESSGVRASAVRLDNALIGDTSAVGTYCPIPVRGKPDKAHALAMSEIRAGDSLLVGGQSLVAPDTAAALCTGTAAPSKRP